MRLAGWMAAALMCGGLVPAFAAGATGRLVVRVEDLSGRPLTDAAVVVQSTEAAGSPAVSQTGTPRTVFELPAQARYDVRVTLAGYLPQTSESVLVRAGATRTVLFVLRKQSIESVRVLASIEDPGESRTTFSSDALEDLPIQGRSYQNALTLAPGVTDTNHDGNPNVFGARERDFRATVDGVANVDPLTGLYQSEVNPDAIADLEIVTSGAAAENGGAVGGFARIVTKEGSNILSGTFGVYWRSSALDRLGSSQNVPSYDDVRPSFSLTGPIVKDRLYFAMFHEIIDKGVPVVAPARRSPAFINGSNGLATTGGRFVIDSTGTRSLDKLTWQASGRNKLTLQFQADPLDTAPLGISELAVPDSAYELGQGGNTILAQWSFQGSTNFLLQTTFGRNRTSVSYIPTTRSVKNLCPRDGWARARVDVYGNPGGPPIDEDYCLDLSSSVHSGSYFRDYSDDRTRYTFKSDMSWYVSSLLGTSHTLRAGVIAEKRTYEGGQSQRSVEDWQEYGSSPVTGARGNGLIHREVFVAGYPNFQENTAEGTNYGLYLEDLFTIQRNLTIRAGARVDQENLTADGFEPFDPRDEESRYREFYARCAESPIPGNIDRCVRSGWRFFHRYEVVPALAASVIRGILDTGGALARKPERFRISNTNVSPRLSVTWDPGTVGRIKLFGTAGRYFGETFLAVPSFEQGPDSFLYTYDVEGVWDTRHCHTTPGGPGTFQCRYLSLIPSDTQATVALASIRQVDRNLKTPHQDEYTAGIAAEVLPETSVTVSYVSRDYKDQLQDVDLNHYVVSPAVGFGLPQESVHNPFFNEVLQVGNLNSSTYRAWVLEIHRRFHRNWELEVSYVHSRAQGDAEDYNQILGNDPGLTQNVFGYLDYDVRDVVKVNGRAQLPLWNLRLAGALSYQSGTPYSIVSQQFQEDIPQQFGNVVIGYGRTRRFYPTGQRNDQRNEGYYNVDLGLRKDFAVKKADMTVSLDVFNALDDQALLTVTNINGNQERLFRPSRQFQLGAKIAF